MYWVLNDQIQRANLNGMGATTIVTEHLPSNLGLLFPVIGGIDLDLAGGKIYWTANVFTATSSEISIRRANLNGSDIETVVVVPFPLAEQGGAIAVLP